MREREGIRFYWQMPEGLVIAIAMVVTVVPWLGQTAWRVIGGVPRTCVAAVRAIRSLLYDAGQVLNIVRELLLGLETPGELRSDGRAHVYVTISERPFPSEPRDDGFQRLRTTSPH